MGGFSVAVVPIDGSSPGRLVGPAGPALRTGINRLGGLSRA